MCVCVCVCVYGVSTGVHLHKCMMCVKSRSSIGQVITSFSVLFV